MENLIAKSKKVQMTKFSQRFDALSLILLLLTLVVIFAPTPAHADTVLFWDDFKSGTADNWEMIAGYGFSVANEAICLPTS
jgi:hypothetical protein